MIIIIMGVSGAGKTTVGQRLAHELGWKFFDADDFHSAANRDKMSRGVALTNEDRADWLMSLRELLNQNIEASQSVVLACSALKQEYRDVLQINNEVHFVYLYGSYQQIGTRMKERKNHYMKAEMLKSQFDALEEPSDALTINISKTPKEIVAVIRKEWNL
ncbi:MAG TPA: gluconokinase [Anaerolineales bacterium]